MRIEQGNIWDYHSDHSIVIPTNIGWRYDGRNVMGRGLAQQASQRFPMLAHWYGRECMKRGKNTPVIYHAETKLILFPVKQLNEDQPHLSWQAKASLRLITRSAEQLVEKDRDIPTPVALPLVGCGNGKLAIDDVLPILEQYLIEDFYVLVHRGEL